MSTLSKRAKATLDSVAARMNPQPLRAAQSDQSLANIVPAGDMSILVTLDELRAFDLNPRTTKNPRFDEIKESIRARGLDSPPQITRRPGADHYIIRNGGNTRLQVLNELWQETQDERFYRIQCLFKPWENEISTLVGHLAENELRGSLLFIEKSLGVSNAKKMYEEETGKKISQNELSKRLTESGLPISRSLITRMLDCVDSIYPAIPQLLYSGLGKHQIESLLALRSGLANVYKRYGPSGSTEAQFKEFWLTTLSAFEVDPASYRFNVVEDTMIGDMSRLINREYKMIELDLVMLRKGGKPEEEQEPENIVLIDSATTSAEETTKSRPSQKSQSTTKLDRQEKSAVQSADRDNDDIEDEVIALSEEEKQKRRDQLTVSPSQQTDRVKKILRKIHETTGEEHIEFDEVAPKAIPLQVGGAITNVTDVWHIEDRHDSVEELRSEIHLIAAEMCNWAGCAKSVVATQEGMGFRIDQEDVSDPKKASMFFLLGSLLRYSEHPGLPKEELLKMHSGMLSQIIVGSWEIQIGPFKPIVSPPYEPIPDSVFIYFLRLLRLMRRLVELTKLRSKT